MSPITILLGVGLLACVLARLPDRYRPAWSRRLDSWQVLIGLVAVVMAIFIVMSPEFYALGLLGDSAFFDLLVLAISLQIQMTGSRFWHLVAAGFSRIKRFMALRAYSNFQAMASLCLALTWTWADVVSAVQKWHGK